MSELRVDEDRLPPSLGQLTMALNGGMTPLDYSNTTHHGHQGQSDQSGKAPNWSEYTIQGWMAGSIHKIIFIHIFFIFLFLRLPFAEERKFSKKCKPNLTPDLPPHSAYGLMNFTLGSEGRWPLMKVSWEQQSVEHHSERWPWHQSFALIYGGGGDDIVRHSCSSEARLRVWDDPYMTYAKWYSGLANDSERWKNLAHLNFLPICYPLNLGSWCLAKQPCQKIPHKT